MSLRYIAFLAALAAATPAIAKGPPQALPNWPCDTPNAGPLEAQMLWPGAAPPAEPLRDDAAAQHLADFLTASENTAGMGEREIASFAEKNGPVKTDRAIRIVAGMVERGNVLRRLLLDGIKEQVARSRALADAIADDNTKIKAAEAAEADGGGGMSDMLNSNGQQPAAPPPAPGPSSAQLKDQLKQHVSQLGSADDVAESLCRRLVFDERKMRRLTAVLKSRAAQ